MKMLAQKLNLDISWTVSSPLIIPKESKEFDVTKYFPSYNIYVYDNKNNLIDKILDLNNKKVKEIYSFEGSPFQQAEGRLGNIDGGIKIIADLERNKYRKKIVENYFGYSFEQNSNLYYKNNNKYGFYSTLKFKVEFNSELSNSLEFEVEYPFISENNLNSIFSKIYRSNDLYSCKFLIDYNLFNQYKANSIIIFPKANFNSNIIELNKIFISNIENIWLNSNDQSKLLTVPFAETEMVDEYKDIDLEIYILNKVQSEIVQYFIDKLSQNDLKNLLLEKYINQSFSYNLMDKSEAFFQGNLYLFNESSFENLSWPQNDTNINGVIYNKFFPRSHKDNVNTILFDKYNLIQDDITASIDNIDLGYYFNNNYYNIEQDILYFSSNNILKINIIEVQKILNKNKIYIEVITCFRNTENILFKSNQLKLENKYTKISNNELYSTFLLSYEYDNQEIINFSNSNNINLANLIYKEIPIDISFKII